jgi:hypothetical protein
LQASAVCKPAELIPLGQFLQCLNGKKRGDLRGALFLHNVFVAPADPRVPLASRTFDARDLISDQRNGDRGLFG